MPYEIREKDGKFEVVNTSTQEVKATHDDRAKAERQLRMLEGLERGMKENNG